MSAAGAYSSSERDRFGSHQRNSRSSWLAGYNESFIASTSGLTDLELSCEHPPVELNEERMLVGKHEVAGYDARVFVSWNDVLGGEAR